MNAQRKTEDNRLRVTPDFIENPLRINRDNESDTSFRANGINYSVIQENDKAVMLQCSTRYSRFFEVWIKLPNRNKSIRTDYAHPTDEDFGVWAWSAYTKEKALKIFEEISSGKRVLIPMSQQV
jgi:hypothetical protein